MRSRFRRCTTSSRAKGWRPARISSIPGWYSPRQASANADQSRSKPRGPSTARASPATPERQSTRVPNTSKNNALGFAGTLYPSRFAVLGLKRATRVEVNRGDGPRALPLAGWLWHNARRFGPLFKVPRACCRSSVVEHSLGKGEVDSSILSGSTIAPPKTKQKQCYSQRGQVGPHLGPHRTHLRCSPASLHIANIARELACLIASRQAGPPFLLSAGEGDARRKYAVLLRLTLSGADSIRN